MKRLSIRNSFSDFKFKLFGKQNYYDQLPDLVYFTCIILIKIYEFYDLKKIKLLELMKSKNVEMLIKEIPRCINKINETMNLVERENWINLYAIDIFKLKFKILPLLKLSVDSKEIYNKWLIYELNDLSEFLKLSFNLKRTDLINSYIKKNSISINFINLNSIEFERHISNYRYIYHYEGSLIAMVNLITIDSVKILKLILNNSYYFINNIQNSLDLFFKVSDFNSVVSKDLKRLNAIKFNTLDGFKTNVLISLKDKLVKYYDFLIKLNTLKEFKNLQFNDVILNIDSLIGCYQHCLLLVDSIELNGNQNFNFRFNAMIDLISISSLSLTKSIKFTK